MDNINSGVVSFMERFIVLEGPLMEVLLYSDNLSNSTNWVNHRCTWLIIEKQVVHKYTINPRACSFYSTYIIKYKGPYNFYAVYNINTCRQERMMTSSLFRRNNDDVIMRS